MAPGSYLVVSHGTGDNLGHDAVAEMQQVYGEAAAPAAPRTAGRHSPVLRRAPDGPAGAVRCRGLACRPRAGTARPGPVPRRHREEAVTLTLMRTAGPEQAGSGA